MELVPAGPDQYAIPTAGSAGEFRDRGSKFVARLAPARDEEQALAIVAEQAAAHAKCNHHCYAYRIGEGRDRYRANDDGEPSGTAGKPILGQIDKAELSDVVIVVSRYFGGTKLGTSGLINAYREAARLAIAAAPTGYRPLRHRITLAFGYDLMTPVMSALSSLRLEMAEQKFTDRALIHVDVPRSQSELAVRQLKARVAGVYEEEVDADFQVPGLTVSVA